MPSFKLRWGICTDTKNDLKHCFFKKVQTFNSITITMMKSQIFTVISPQLTKCSNKNKLENETELLCTDTFSLHRISHLDYKSSKARKEVFLLGREGGAEGGVKEGKTEKLHNSL